MSREWIAVADRNHCRVFQRTSRQGQLEELFDLVSPTSRLKNQDIDADRHGRSFDRQGQGRHAMDPPVEATEQEAIRFAKDVAERLDTGRKEQRFDRLYVVAEPRFLGHLRQEFTRPLKDVIAAEVDKDWATHEPEQIRQRLRAELWG